MRADFFRYLVVLLEGGVVSLLSLSRHTSPIVYGVQQALT
jgi:hypothetical protein